MEELVLTDEFIEAMEKVRIQHLGTGSVGMDALRDLGFQIDVALWESDAQQFANAEVPY